MCHPRYCPSVEDKVMRFADKDSHQIFIEPEGLNTTEVYPNGISTSLGFETQIELVRSKDILASVAALDAAPFTVGFAAETENVRDYALGKLKNKKLDMIVANRVGDDCGFDRDENAVDMFWESGEQTFAQAAKTELARDIIKLVVERYLATRGSDTQPALPKLHAID